MRVLLLLKGLGRGGAERIVVDTVASGDQSRFQYEVAYVLPWKDALVPELERLGATPHQLGDGRPELWPKRLRDLLRQRTIDIVHAHSPVPAVAARLVKGSRPVVYTEHNMWSRYSPPTRWANRLTFGLNAHVFAVSDEVRRSIRLRARRLQEMPIETLRHGIAPIPLEAVETWRSVRNEFGVPDDTPIAVTVANLKAHKGHRHLIDAAAYLKTSMPQLRFVCVGVGPAAEEMRRYAEHRGVEQNVIFTGYRDDVPRIVAASDVFVLPSEHEGLPLALLEAMSLGKACVATSVGGIPEVIRDGDDGVLVRPHDAQGLATAVASLLADDAYRTRLGRFAQERARAFDARSAVERMEAVYEELGTR